VDDIEQAYTQKEESVSDLPTEIETLHSDAIIKGLPQKAPDNMQTGIATAPKQSHNRGDNDVFEAVTEVPSTAQDHSEDDVRVEVPEEHTVSPVLQSQTPGEKPVLVVDVPAAAGSATPEHAEAGKETS
jgi:hypothetical protein